MAEQREAGAAESRQLATAGTWQHSCLLWESLLYNAIKFPLLLKKTSTSISSSTVLLGDAVLPQQWWRHGEQPQSAALDAVPIAGM